MQHWISLQLGLAQAAQETCSPLWGIIASRPLRSTVIPHSQLCTTAQVLQSNISSGRLYTWILILQKHLHWQACQTEERPIYPYLAELQPRQTRQLMQSCPVIVCQGNTAPGLMSIPSAPSRRQSLSHNCQRRLALACQLVRPSQKRTLGLRHKPLLRLRRLMLHLLPSQSSSLQQKQLQRSVRLLPWMPLLRWKCRRSSLSP